ncbi:MAG: hypothetical protein WBZ42_00065, partial [Halobacteriota archaeon]
MAQARPTPDIYAQQRFAKDLTGYIISKCAGTHKDDNEISATDQPSRTYIIGTLAARKDEKKALTATDVSNEQEGRASIRAQRLKVSFLAKTDSLRQSSEIQIEAVGNVYYLISLEQEDPSKRDTLPDQKGQAATVKSTDSEFKKSSKRWRRANFEYRWQTKPAARLSQEIDFSDLRRRVNDNSAIDKLVPEDAWKAELSIETSEFGTNKTLVTIFYTNTNIEPLHEKRKPSFERTLFDCRLRVS